MAVWAQSPPAGAPVVVEGRTLFTVRTSLGPFTQQERAQATAGRILRIAKELTASEVAITAIKGETSTDIALGDRVLLTLTEADASAAGRSRDELAAEYIRTIQAVIASVRMEYSSRSLFMGALYTLLLTATLIALLILMRKLRSIAVIRLQGVNIPVRQIKDFLIQATMGIRLFAALIFFYVYVSLVLSFFPWTREFTPRLVEYILGPLRSAGAAILAYLPSLFLVIVFGTGAYLLVRCSHFVFDEVGRGSITWTGFHADWAEPTHKLVRLLILAFTLVVVFPYLPGSKSPAFQGVSIFIGVLFSLGSTSAVANIIGGVILTYTRAFQIGDRVKIADTVGDIVEKTLLATRIKTVKNEFITIPNSMVLGSHIINFTSPEGGAPLILHTSVTIGYDSPWRQIHELLVAAALRTSLILKDPAPFVLQTSLDDFYVTYEINAYTWEASRMASVYAELHQNVQDCFNESGVEIMSPHYGSLRDGNPTTVPVQYLPKDYSAAPFRFVQTAGKHDLVDSN